MRRQLALLTSVILVLCAGVVIGRLTARLPATGGSTPGAGPGPSWIAEQLNLTTQQRIQMDAIWADTRQKMDQTFEKRHELDHQRDAAITALLSDSQKTAYDKITADYRQQRAQLDNQRQSLITDAEKRSRDLLDPTQQTKYDALTREMHNRHNSRHADNSAPTQPTTQTGTTH